MVVVFHNSTGLQLKVHGFVSTDTDSILCSKTEVSLLVCFSFQQIRNQKICYILVAT